MVRPRLLAAITLLVIAVPEQLADRLHGTCPWTVVIGLGVFLVVAVSERLSRRAPAALVALAAAANRFFPDVDAAVTALSEAD